MDLCCLKRPYDDQTDPKVRLETDAVLIILSMAESGKIRVVSSEVLEFENAENTNVERRQRAALVISGLRPKLRLNAVAIAAAKEIEMRKIGGYDALHLAIANENGVDSFLTTDARLLRFGAKSGFRMHTKIMSPVDFVKEAR